MPLGPPLVHPPPMVGIGCPEEGECILAEKQLKKTKRIRTRVDAGEPRNPYSAATALASVGSSLSSNLCPGASSVVSAVAAAAAGSGPHLTLAGGQFSRYPPHHSVVQSWWRAANPNHYQQSLQHPMTYCATAGAAVQPLPLVHYIAQPQQPLPHCLATARQRQGAAAMLSELFGGHNKNSATTEGMGILDKLAHGSDATGLLRGPEPDNVLLREILQGRKRDILTLEEIEAARALHQNINNNNSPVYKNNSAVEMTTADSSADEATREHNTSHDSAVEDDDIQCDSVDGADVTDAGDSGSPDSSAECGSDPKKNRLESIVSVMRCSPPPPHALSVNAINGCKKRKLYLPQQHETRSVNDSTNGTSSVSGSPSSPPISPQPPGTKSRKLESNESHDVHDVEDDVTDLQIDLSLRSEARLRGSSSPDLPRASSPKPSASVSGSDCGEISSNYLIDYAKHLLNTRNQHHLHNQQVSAVQDLQNSSHDISHKISLLRSLGGESGPGAAGLAEIETLADLLKTEITASLAVIIDSIVNKFVQHRKIVSKQNESIPVELPFSSADFTTPRNFKTHMSKPNGFNPPTSLPQIRPHISENNLNTLNLPPHLRPPMYKGPPSLFTSTLPPVSMGQTSPFSSQEPEQDEALSLVVTPKKKRHKVTDSRLTPRTVGRLLEDLPRYPQITPTSGNSSPRYNSPPSPPPQSSLPPHSLTPTLHHSLQHPHMHPSRHNPFNHPPPPLLPVSLPTSVAIPNPSLHETSLLYSGVYYNRGPPSPPDNRREESPVAPHLPPHPHPHPLLHPAFLAASSPDSFSHFLKANDDRGSDCSPADGPPFDQHPLSFYTEREYREYREYNNCFLPVT